RSRRRRPVRSFPTRRSSDLVTMPGIESGMEDLESLTSALVKFDCHSVDRFNNQVRQIVDSIRQWNSAGYRVVISTEQPQRILGRSEEHTSELQSQSNLVCRL